MSRFDDELEKELARLEEEKKKKKNGVTVESATQKSYDLGKYSYLPSSTQLEASDLGPVIKTGSNLFDSVISGTRKSLLVNEDEEEEEPEDDGKLDFFQKGTLSDGWQFGDILKGNLASTADLGINLVKGAGGIIEGVSDLILYGAAGVANATGNKNAAKTLKKGASANLMDELFETPSNYLEKRSFFGRTTDSIAQGVGQVGTILLTGGLGAAAGLGAAGTTALTTGVMGVSGMGSGMGEAYQKGATDEEAVTYGVIAGAADALTELIFGGLGKAVNAVGLSKGLSSADDMLAKKVSNLFSNQIAKNFAEYGIKAGAEGLEEVLAGIAQAVGKKVTYMSEEEFGKILQDENLLEQFVVGAVTSGIAQAPSVKVANKTNTDFITGLTENDRAVVKKEVENRISELEKDGKKLTSKEKANIQAEVEEALERGEISLDTIEEVLGGDDFTALQDIVKKENEALAELAELYEGDELQKHAESLLKDSKRGELQKKLHESVFEKAKASRLGESYRHLDKYQADLSRYSEKEQAIIKKAMESGVLNNSRKTHDFVDFVAKISSYSGIDFEFTSNQRLRETGFVFDGNTTNGFYDPSTNKVVINSQSKKYLHSLVGHEVTHALKGSNLYDAIQDIAFEYAKSTGEYKNRLKAAHDMYSNKTGYTGQEGLAKIKEEAVADMIGDYLFTDSKFVNYLSASNPNVFQKIYGEIKHLLKLATAGSQQARQLEQLKYTFEKALREKGKGSATAEGDARLSVSETTDGRSVAVVDNDILSNIDTSKWDKETKKAAQKAANNELKKFSDGFVINGVEYIDSKKTRREYTKSDYSEALAKHDTEAFLDKMRAASVVDDVVRVATDWTKDGKLKYERKDFVDFVRGKTLIKSGDRTYRAVVLAGITKDGKTIFYDVEDVYPDSFEIKESESYTTVSTDELPNSILKDSDTDTVTQNGKNVKYSLSPQQEEYFKDSVVRDENGNLKVMYHGTSRGGHTMFDPYGKAKYGLFGLGSYFTDNKEVAESYTKKGKGQSPQVYETYLNIKSPMDMDAAADPAAWAKAFPEAHFPESGTNEQFYRAMEEYFEDNEYVRWEAEEAAMDAIMGMGYDGITHIGGGRFNKNDDTRHRVYIAFQPEQIKDVGNTKPTDDPDIRFSLSEAVEETKDLVALHNLTADKLTKSLELGGLPMPSLAITKADIPHSNFGDITLIFDRKTIDPKANKKNKVYSADAWTPVFPRVEYEADSKVGNQISGRLRDLEGKIAGFFQRDLRRLQHGFDDYLNRQGGEEGLIQYAMDNYGLKAAYLEEQGKHIEEITKQEEATKEYNPNAADKYQKIMEILGVTTAEEIRSVNLKDARDNHGEELEAVYPGVTKTAMRMGRVFNAVSAYLENKDGGTVYNTVTDGNATKMAVDKALDAEGFEAWTRTLFAGIVKDSGIYNNKELFTPSGNRRTFKQTHLPVTLENIVKAMAGQNSGNAKNVSGFNGIKTLRAATAETFKSVDEMHQRKDRLQNLTQEEVDAINDALQSRLFEIMQTIDNEGKQSSERNPYIRLDSIGETITEIGESGKYNVADIQKTFRQYGKEIGDDTALAVKQLLFDVTQMPVNIFEAKPQRVVGFDEAKVFVIPNNVDTKLKQELLNRGYNIAEYDPKVEGDRQRVVNQFEDLKFSLADAGKKYGDLHVTSEDIRYNPEGRKSKYDFPVRQDIAPVAPTVQQDPRYSIEEMFPDEVPAEQELNDLLVQQEDMEGRMLEAAGVEDFDTFYQINAEYEKVMGRIAQLEAEGKARDAERVGSLEDADAPPEMSVTRDQLESDTSVPDPMGDRVRDSEDFKTAKSFMVERPEVKPFFQAMARAMLGDIRETVRGQRFYNDQVYAQSGAENAWTGVSRQTAPDIADLLDNYRYSYDQIENALTAIIEDRVTERHLAAKNIEFMLNDRLLYGYTDVWGEQMPANQDYIRLSLEMSVNDDAQQSFDSYMKSVEDNLPPEAMDIGPVQKPVKKAPVKEKYEAVTPKKKQPRMVKATPEAERIAKILDEEPTPQNKKSRAWARFKANVLDKGAVFEDLSLQTKNRELMGKWNFILGSEARAQRLMGNGAEGVKSLNAIREEVENSGKSKQFYSYLYHKHNIDRMQLEERYEDMENKPVFGYSVTAEKSREIVANYERTNPSFKRYAQDVYDYMNHLRKLMVDNGAISQDTADLWADMYPNYVPIRRAGKNGAAVNVPLDTGRTGVNAPVKKATGGNMDILPLFDTMALRTAQTYKAIAKNSFGVELKRVLGTTIEKSEASVGGMIDSVEQQEGLLQEGKNGSAPTFTVFENGEKVTFEITEDMYDALKPVSEGLAYTNKVANTISNFHRGLLTEYNPVFMLTNAIKDAQDVMINSQHPGRTYLKLGEAYAQMFTKGYWYTEYMENGGEQNTYFDDREISFDTERKGVSKILDLPPFSTISAINNFIEMTPRLAEYIASREAGRSIEVSMLDAARVTTNFQAGGDLTKFLNRNGATFLNASVQGLMQNVRNFREAKANGWKGWANLATKFAVAGLPAVILNNLLWDDDDEYEELSDYVKQNYYIVAKYGDGKFVRIPKGRTIAVIQAGIEQIGNALSGDDEVDLNRFLELVVSNLAPNNPIEDNILAPIMQVKKNETWYGEDLVPTRLQDLPAAEQFDESTDNLSKWLGEKLDISPVKINYLLDQYTGGVGDTILPMLTPEAESGDDSLVGNLLAPLKSKFTTDSVMNNQNVSDFYDTKDELTTAAKSSKATEEDVLKYKYINSINSELSKLYAQKREVQNSNLPDSIKYEQVRAIQKQIVNLTKESLDAYDKISVSGNYATVGDRYFESNDEGEWEKMSDSQVTKHNVTSAAGDAAYASDGEVHYRWYEPGEDSEEEPGWRKISDKELERQNEVTSALGITPEEYWSKQEEYSYAYDHPENYAVAKSVGGYDAYRAYSSELYDIKADKDESGKSISGSRKEKVIDYVNGLDIDYGMRLILFKNEYNADDTYNEEIIEYLNSRDDISASDMVTILRKLGFTVYDDGTIEW